jgi:hypothetical protein
MQALGSQGGAESLNREEEGFCTEMPLNLSGYNLTFLFSSETIFLLLYTTNMKNFLKPTKLKIILTPMLAALYLVITQITIAYAINAFFYPSHPFGGLPCIFHSANKEPVPFMTPNATLFSEWQNAGTLRCGSESQLRQIFH